MFICLPMNIPVACGKFFCEFESYNLFGCKTLWNRNLPLTVWSLPLMENEREICAIQPWAEISKSTKCYHTVHFIVETLANYFNFSVTYTFKFDVWKLESAGKFQPTAVLSDEA